MMDSKKPCCDGMDDRHISQMPMGPANCGEVKEAPEVEGGAAESDAAE